MADPGKKNFFSRRLILGTTIGGALLFMVTGVVLWGGFNTSLEVTNTQEFCITCHEMAENVYVEYQGTIHDSNRTGVRAGCPDCHVPRPWVHKVIRKIKASNEIYHKLMGTVDTPEKFDEHRLTMAKRVWQAMKSTDSRECRNCHDFDTMDPAKQQPRARKQHLNAMQNGNTCIDCHKGIAHKPVEKLLTEEETEEFEKPLAEYVREVPQSFLDGMALADQAEAKAEAEAKAQRDQQREAMAAAREAEQVRIEEAVASALADYQAGVESAAASDSGNAAGFGIDWTDAPVRDFNVFYTGQASIEWVLRGRDHGGARPLKAGDRCTLCHEKETQKIGDLIVNGEKLEPTPIPGKRGSIPVSVQAAHDDENLYLRVQWPEGEHSPVPFVEGGKMDPDNPMKFAVMLATDDVEYADRGGCWATCHHDSRTMPDTPDAEAMAAAGLPLDLDDGVTKYLKESRTKIEMRGRGGKALGGWDQLKDTAALDAEMQAGHYMDLLRYRSGAGDAQDGHVLDQRVMSGGNGFEVVASLESGLWTVEMKRSLVSDRPGDINLALDQVYNIGFAIHDDYSHARFHHVSLGYKIGFDNTETDINAVKREATAVAVQSGGAGVSEVGDGGPDIDWSQASERDVVLFYPGQSSMEWVLRGRDHGGARPLKAGDRCTLCHEKEAVKIGDLIVSGEKLEPTPIPGKRGSIPVSVQAAHDADNLYLRFSWQDGEHAPVPFVEGGKMDPDNPVKLAFMIATDDVKWADHGGCWATCHNDLRSMPDAPDTAAIDAAGLPLNTPDGITKYLEESRTKIEVRGRGGIPLGGWDKMKDVAAVDTEAQAGHYMDLVRFKSGDGLTEDGHVLAERAMAGGSAAISSGKLENGMWAVTVTRALKSDAAGDLELESGKLFNIGFAIHDDYTNARFHHVSLGYKLGLDNADAEINAIGIQ